MNTQGRMPVRHSQFVPDAALIRSSILDFKGKQRVIDKIDKRFRFVLQTARL